jgi:hypothetical protein
LRCKGNEQPIYGNQSHNKNEKQCMEGYETNKAGRIEQAMHHNLPNNVHVISTTNIATPNISDKRHEKIKELQATSLFPI